MLILGDPGAVSRVNKMSMMKVLCKIETSTWALTLTEPVSEAFELHASDWPEKTFSGQSAKRRSRVTFLQRGKFLEESFRTSVNETGKSTSFNTATRNKRSTMNFCDRSVKGIVNFDTR